MNYDAKSPTFLSAADVDCQAADEATTTPISSTSPTDVDEVSTANDWCAWCGRGQSTDAGDLDAEEAWPPAGDEDDRRRQQPAYDQLRFCSRSCLSRYKMDLFCRETQRYLQQFQGSDKVDGSTGPDNTKEHRILITPELWSQSEVGDDHVVSEDAGSTWNNGKDCGTARRRRSIGDQNVDDGEGSSTAKQKARKINTSDKWAASRTLARSSTSDAPLGRTLSRTPADSLTAGRAGRPIKSESGLTDTAIGSSRTEGPTNIGLPWMAVTSTAVPNSLPSPFPRGFLTNPFWSHSPPGFPVPPSHARPPSFAAAAASMPFGFGAPGWLPSPAGLVPPTAMFVPYPIPVPLPLPLPIPIPLPVSKSPTTSDTSTDCYRTREGNSQGSNENCSPRKSNADRHGDTWNAPTSATPKSTSASTSSVELSSDALDLSTGGPRSRSSDSSAPVVWTDAVLAPASVSSTIDASPYLARRSLILDAPAVDRKCFGDQVPAVGSIRAPSLTATGKRFGHQHHRRRTATMPLVKSK